ncbi:MAG: shikimate kinase [Nitrospirota bacterium]
MKNIVLTGFMGTGKTVVGTLLAERLRRPLIDVDSEIEREQRMTVAEIFAREGEAAFRDMEAAVIRRLSERAGVIIATGGGAVVRQENRENLRKNGVVVCLTASPEATLERTRAAGTRPLLQVDDPLQRIRELLEARGPYYAKADMVIDTEGKTPADVAEEIVQRIREEVNE